MYLSGFIPNFKEVGVLFAPERPNTYSRISQLIVTYHSYIVRMEPKLSLEFLTKIDPLRIDLRIILICSHESIIRLIEDGPSSYGWLHCDLDCRYIYSSLNYSGIIWLGSIDRTNGYEHGFWSLANQPLESTPNSHAVRHTKHPRRKHYSDEALLAIYAVVAHYYTKERALAPAM